MIAYILQNPIYIVIILPGIIVGIYYIILKLKGEKRARTPNAEEGKEVSPERKTADEMTNVRDIDDIYLYRKDNYLIGYLRLGNINIDLLSDDELTQMTQRLALSFGGDKKDFAYLTLPSQVNLDPNKEYLKQLYQNTEELGRRKGINLMLQEMTRLSTSGENFEHQHCIQIWKEIGTNIKDSQNELKVRLNEFRERFLAVGIPCEILQDREIIKMCNVFANPQQAPFTPVRSKYEYDAVPVFSEIK